MALANGKITAPVSIDDLKNLFGEGSGDLATLCTSPKINVWAKYKPTVYPSPFPDDWHKAKDGNYGINITVENGKRAAWQNYRNAEDEGGCQPGKQRNRILRISD